MKTVVHFLLDESDAILLGEFRHAEFRLSAFRNAVEAAWKGAEGEEPRSGLNSIIRGMDFTLEQFEKAERYIIGMVASAQYRLDEGLYTPEQQAEITSAVENARDVVHRFRHAVFVAMHMLPVAR